MFDIVIGVVIGASYLTRWCESTIEGRRGQRETGRPPEAHSERPRKETKQRDGLSTAACERESIDNIGEGVGCGEHRPRDTANSLGQLRREPGVRIVLPNRSHGLSLLVSQTRGAFGGSPPPEPAK